MKTKFYYVAFVMLFSLGLMAQKGAPMKASSTGTAAYMREIPALSSMKNIISAEGMGHDGLVKSKGTNTFVPGKGFPKNGDPLVAAQRKSTPLRASRAPLVSFDAHQGNSTPTDPTGAIGPNHYVYAFNTGFGIRDRAGNALVGEASLSTIFPGESLGDPIVVYDNFAERFIIMEFSNSPNGFLIAVCKGPDPVNDGWYTYRFNTSSFPDYEKLSIWSDGYYITANKDQNSADANDVVFAVERDKMLIGDPAAQVVGFPLPGIETSGFYSPGGFNATGSTLPPVGTGSMITYMQDDSWSGISTDHLKVWTTTVDWSNTSNSSISQPQEIPTSPFDSVFDGGSFRNLNEPGSGPDIDALQATMMYMTNYRRFGGYNSVVMNFVVDLDGSDSLAGIRWFELRQSGDGQPWSIYQEGTYTQPDGFSAFCGSIAMDGQGNIGLAYTVVSDTEFTGIRYTGRLASDPLNTMTVAEGTGIRGDRTTTGSSGRYGDYGQMTIDPLDDATFWHIGEYMRSGGSTRKNRVVAFKLEEPEPDTEAPSTPANLAASNITDVSATLTWDPSTDDRGVAGYDVYQDGILLTTVATTTTDVTELSPATSYDFTVVAKDAAGNESGASASVTVDTVAPDTEAPSTPGNVTASNTGATQTTLSWDAATDNVSVAEYDVLQDGVVVATVVETTTTVTGLASETAYEFTVLARDAAGNVSDASAVLTVTTLGSTGCISGVSTPYSESFENTLGDWTQASGDDLDWTVDANGTPSNRTGPASAADGSFYIFVEASGNGTGYPNKQAILNSPCFDLNDATSAEFTFEYHMYGVTNFGSLDVEASSDDGLTWTSIWSLSGNQGNSWKVATIDLANYVGSGLQLRFNRVTGNNWRADAALDNIKLTVGDGDGGGGNDDCAAGDLTLTITFDDYPEETSWTVRNASGSVVASEEYSSSNSDGSTVREVISGLAAGDYTFTMADSYGDGICCRYGNGSYVLTSASGDIASGGEFTRTDATEFCVGSSVLDAYPLSGLRAVDQDAFKIYPNPVVGTLNITVGNRVIDNVKIFSMYGQLVREISNQGTSDKIDVSNLSSGTYFVRFTSNKEELEVTRKFVITNN